MSELEQSPALPGGEGRALELAIDTLLADFQRACELSVNGDAFDLNAMKKLRAVLRNDLRARLLAASAPVASREPAKPMAWMAVSPRGDKSLVLFRSMAEAFASDEPGSVVIPLVAAPAGTAGTHQGER